MKKNFGTDFLMCGISGWCMECLWTGVGSFVTKDRCLSCKTSIWMFPIYGMAACLSPICKKISGKSTAFRGSVYMLCIYGAEYATGRLLKKHKACPWDYSHTRFHYRGVIRLDYAPAWFLAGLFYEKLLTRP
ncbi:MAG: hypothetical protein IJY09_03855 [Lachnospiraceae bacterium]|nr:hypothetical protein [Lachnospiraceae bacterium]